MKIWIYHFSDMKKPLLILILGAAAALLLIFASYKLGERKGKKEVSTLLERLDWAEKRMKEAEGNNLSIVMGIDEMNDRLDTLSASISAQAELAKEIAAQSTRNGNKLRQELDRFMLEVKKQEEEESNLRELAKSFKDE